MPSPTPQCCRFWKGSLRFTLNYGRQLIYNITLTQHRQLIQIIITYCYGTKPAECNELFLLLLIPGEYSSRWWISPQLNTLPVRLTFNTFLPMLFILSLIYIVPRKPEFVSFFRTLYWSTTHTYCNLTLTHRKQLEKQGQAHKWCTPMDLRIWPSKSRTTSSNIHTVAMWGYGM